MVEDYNKLRSVFASGVKESFGFIEEFGSKIKQIDADSFGFNLGNTLVRILLTKGHGYDINILVKPSARKNDYGIGVLCEVFGIENNLKSGFETPAQLNKLINVYRDVLKDKIIRLIVGNMIDWNRVDEYIAERIAVDKLERQKKSDKYKNDKIKNDAEIAFQNKDYKRVVKLLNSMRENLTPSENKKFEYSLKQVVAGK
jgi:hypothetical protein